MKAGWKRLLRLADHLETVPRKRYNHGVWAEGPGFCGKGPLPEPQHAECGTVACALGWATTIPAFRRAGLRLKEDEYYEGFVVEYNDRGWSFFGEEAGAEFFELSEEDAHKLFIVGPPTAEYARDTTPKQMARYIRQTIRRLEKDAQCQPK